MPGKGKKGGKAREVSKVSKVSKASRRTKRTTPKRYAPTPIADAARLFLYECPGGMDTNEKRDKFLECAKKIERTGGDRYNVVENVVRAALFQGQDFGRGNPKMRKKSRKKGPLDLADRHVLRILLEEMGAGLGERLGLQDYDHGEYVTALTERLSTLHEHFDGDDQEPDFWKTELNQLASEILEYVLEQARERLQALMGESAWKTMGLPKF